MVMLTLLCWLLILFLVEVAMLPASLMLTVQMEEFGCCSTLKHVHVWE